MASSSESNDSNDFSMSGQVLLLFNENDIRIVLNWEPRAQSGSAEDSTPLAANSQCCSAQLAEDDSQSCSCNSFGETDANSPE